MTFVKPMLAQPLPDDFRVAAFNDWVIEEKLDGHRMCVSVAEKGGDLFGNPSVIAYSRDGIPRVLPKRVLEALETLSSGVYDGELLVPGQRSYGVTELKNHDKLVMVLFDVTQMLGRDVTSFTWRERREMLDTICDKKGIRGYGLDGVSFGDPVMLATFTDCQSLGAIDVWSRLVWDRDGEGLVVKRRSASYQPGKRPARCWLKVKQTRSVVMTVIGYVPGKLGPYSTVLLEDADGIKTTVKAKNYDELERLHADPLSFVGKKLRIDYQERTPDRSYRHPRWDRWESE